MHVVVDGWKKCERRHIVVFPCEQAIHRRSRYFLYRFAHLFCCRANIASKPNNPGSHYPCDLATNPGHARSRQASCSCGRRRAWSLRLLPPRPRPLSIPTKDLAPDRSVPAQGATYFPRHLPWEQPSLSHILARVRLRPIRAWWGRFNC